MIAAAAALALLAAPAAGTAANSATMWVGPQAVAVSVAVSGSTGGMPHPCVHNNGPDTIAVVDYSITDASHTLTAGDRVLAAGDTYCWASGNVQLPATLYVSAVDQDNGRGGKLHLTVHATPTHRQPPPATVGISARTAAIQAAVGATPDGIWGPATQAAVDRLQAAAYMHYGVDEGAVRQLQAALGVPMDGLWGPWTNSALFVAKLNAHA